MPAYHPLILAGVELWLLAEKAIYWPARQALLLERAPPAGDWVFSGSSISWARALEPHYQLIVYLALDPAERQKRIAAYLATGPDFAQWDVWTALETYLELQEAFGWAPFEALFTDLARL